MRWLTKFGGSDLADTLGIREATVRALHGVGAATGKLMSRAPKKPRRAPSATGSHPVEMPTGEPSRLSPVASAGAFDLAPTEDQEMIRATARRFADEIVRPAAHAADAAIAPDVAVLAGGHELALAALVVPETAGGLAEARASVTTALAIEELARGDMGLALAILAPLGVASVLVEHGTFAQQSRWLPRFTGAAFFPAALAMLEPAPGSDPARPRTGAVRAPGGWNLYGEKSLVPLGQTAELFVVLAEIRGAGARLFLVPKDTPGLVITAQPAMGLRAAGLCKLRLDGAFVPDDALLGGDAAFDPAELVARSRLAWGAMAVGGTRAVLDYVIPYCNERKAFGEPITNRQAVAFMIADLAIELEGMRLLVHRAASLADRGRSIVHEAALVRVQCGAKAMKAGTDGVQLLGGHGFVKEHPVERWYRDLRAIAVMEGALLA
ncbi:MAG: acyl-CoA dehydrogenase [Kofleriaceae bacterium]|nr:acyl-CoA dehydrogenase [Kofleriaceae bacterium]